MTIRFPQCTHSTPRPKRFHLHVNPRVVRVARDLYFVGKLKQRDIAHMFDVKQGTVSKWVSGQTWGHVQ